MLGVRKNDGFNEKCLGFPCSKGDTIFYLLDEEDPGTPEDMIDRIKVVERGHCGFIYEEPDGKKCFAEYDENMFLDYDEALFEAKRRKEEFRQRTMRFLKANKM